MMDKFEKKIKEIKNKTNKLTGKLWPIFMHTLLVILS